MTYEVKLLKTEEGYAVWCPALAGCWSQGISKEDGIENIKDAISEYLAAEEDEMEAKAETRTVEVG